MKITVDESPVGVGKTHRAIEMMTGIKGRYVFASERINTMDEMVGRIFDAARINKTLPTIIKIFTQNGRVGNVARQIADIPRTTEGNDHVIVLISHEGMMSSEFEGFEGWTLIVDEVPCMFATHSYRTPTDLAFFEDNYTLSPIDGVNGDNWRMVGLTARGAALAGSSIAECEGHSYLHHFHRRCRDPRRGPVVELTDWSDMTNGQSWVWWSLFHPGQIASFTNRYFLGNGFTKSLAFKLFNEDHIEWETMSDMGNRPLRQRNARIVYYSDRSASMFYFESEAGQADLGKIGAHIASSTPAGSYFWSANGSIKGALDLQLESEAYQRPKQAGTSLLMGYHTAAMFYAAKPSPEVDQAIRGLGFDTSEWVATNEYEAVLQFVTRTSVRDVN